MSALPHPGRAGVIEAAVPLWLTLHGEISTGSGGLFRVGSPMPCCGGRTFLVARGAVAHPHSRCRGGQRIPLPARGQRWPMVLIREPTQPGVQEIALRTQFLPNQRIAYEVFVHLAYEA